MQNQSSSFHQENKKRKTPDSIQNSDDYSIYQTFLEANLMPPLEEIVVKWQSKTSQNLNNKSFKAVNKVLLSIFDAFSSL